MTRPIRLSEYLLSAAGVALALLGMLTIELARGALGIKALGVLVVLTGITIILRGLIWHDTSKRSDVAGAATKSDNPHPAEPSPPTKEPLVARVPQRSARFLDQSDCPAPLLGQLGASFLEWMDHRDTEENLWPAFDRWLRDALGNCLQAGRIRSFRIIEPSGLPVSLNDEIDDTGLNQDTIPALISHVISTGRRYIRTASGNGELIEGLAEQWSRSMRDGTSLTIMPPPVFLLPVRSDNTTIGLLSVGELPAHHLRDESMLKAVSDMVELFWRHIQLTRDLETAVRIDKASGLLSRYDLQERAEHILKRAADDGEPIVVVAISIEGLRRLDDQGCWEDRDWAIRQIGLAIRSKLRSDDLVGRFSDDHFVAVLRRLDLGLGKLIAHKLLDAIGQALNERPHLSECTQSRCSLCEAGGKNFEKAVAQTMDGLQQARALKVNIISGETETVSAGMES